MKNRVISFEPRELEVDAAKVARYFGGSRYQLNAKNRARIEDGIAAAKAEMQPQVVLALHAIASVTEQGQMRLENQTVFDVPCAVAQVSPRELVALVATLGDGFDATVRRLAGRGEIYRSTLVDAVGTCSLEALDDLCRAHLTRLAGALSRHADVRFAPGLQNIPLRLQETLFHLVDGEAIGVHLNSSAIMVPGKSISLFVVFGDRPAGRQPLYKCRHCDLNDCQFRV